MITITQPRTLPRVMMQTSRATLYGLYTRKKTLFLFSAARQVCSRTPIHVGVTADYDVWIFFATVSVSLQMQLDIETPSVGRF